MNQTHEETAPDAGTSTTVKELPKHSAPKSTPLKHFVMTELSDGTTESYCGRIWSRGKGMSTGPKVETYVPCPACSTLVMLDPEQSTTR